MSYLPGLFPTLPATFGLGSFSNLNPDTWLETLAADMFDRLEDNDKYPPYNIIKKDSNHYDIEVAVAGFKQDEITVEIDKNILSVSGKHKVSEKKDTSVYLKRGIAQREFKLQWTLNENSEVSEANIVDGILKIEVYTKIAEDKKPKKIEIGYKT